MVLMKTKTRLLYQTKGRRLKGEEPKNLSHPRSHLPQKTHPKVIMDAKDNTINDDVVNDADQLQDDSVPKTDTATKNNWFKQPSRPPTPDPE
ncbi:hypothetical protein Tco_0784734 [Tanacetum coccineum]